MTTTNTTLQTTQNASGLDHRTQTRDERGMFDREMYEAALAYYGLPSGYKRVFRQHAYEKDGQTKTTLRSCNAAQAANNGQACWTQVNDVREGAALYKSYPKKAGNEDIATIRNVTLDFEYPQRPGIAYEIASDLVSFLVEQGIAVQGQAIENSGAGAHIVLPIDPIATQGPEDAKRWNAAVAHVVKEHIKPQFDELVHGWEIDIDLEGYDISRVLSLPGTWRPRNPAKKDCEALHAGVLRRWLAPYVNGNYPTRQESEQLTALIREAYDALQALPEERATHTNGRKDAHSASKTGFRVWLEQYARKHHTENRSDLFHRLVGATYKRYNENMVRDHASDINEVSGSKYDEKRLTNEIERSLSALQAHREERTQQTGGFSIEWAQECLDKEEWGDAELFASLFDGQVIYDHAEKSWYCWHKHYWKKDTKNTTPLLVAEQVAGHYLQAASYWLELAAKADKEESRTLQRYAEKFMARAKQIRHHNRISNVLIDVTSFPHMALSGSEWDSNKMLLGCQNGVIDLETGELRDGKPEDYIRTPVNVEYKGLDEPCERFKRYLYEVFAEREPVDMLAIIGYLQRLLGYGITGHSTQPDFPVLVGTEARNGKSTLIRILSYILGPVSHTLHNDALLSSKGRTVGSAQEYLSALQGKRLCWASETQEGERFNIAQVKSLTGGDTIVARGLYEKSRTFLPTHTLMLATNHVPHADASDKGFFARVKVIHFNIRFVDHPVAENERAIDRTLDDTLQQEASGILAWLIRGCLEYQQQGLNAPECVRLATEEYRKDEDVIEMFVADCCIEGPEYRVGAAQFYEAYKRWSELNGMKYMGNVPFGKRAKQRYGDPKRSKRGLEYHGVGLVTDDGVGFAIDTSNPTPTTEAAQGANSERSISSAGVGYVGDIKTSLLIPSHEREFTENPTYPTPAELKKSPALASQAVVYDGVGFSSTLHQEEQSVVAVDVVWQQFQTVVQQKPGDYMFWLRKNPVQKEGHVKRDVYFQLVGAARKSTQQERVAWARDEMNYRLCIEQQ